MKPVVALVDLKKNRDSPVREAIDLIGGIDDLNNDLREAVIKVGVYKVGSPHYSTVNVVRDITDAFNASPKIYLAESDNYQGTAMERLQLWKELFTERVIPFDLSRDPDTFPLRIDNPLREIVLDLSKVILKPRTFVSTHVLRSYYKGSILKNLFGLPPTPKKAKYHKNEIFYNMITQINKAIGGIDLSILDGTRYCHYNTSHPTDVIAVGRDPVAVESVGAILAGLKISKHHTINAFAEKAYGISDIDKIDIVGESLDEMTDRCIAAYRFMKKKVSDQPTPWTAERALTKLISSGYFISSNKRILSDITQAMTETDERAEEQLKSITTALHRRARKGALLKEETDEGTLFWMK